MTIDAAIYARTSSDCPLSTNEQTERLRQIAAERGWMITRVFADRPTSVKKGQDRHPGELALLDAIRSCAIDRVLVWSIDRIGKSLADLVGFMETCRLHDVSLWVDEQNYSATVRMSGERHQGCPVAACVEDGVTGA
jgi:DNA invertase Pin-like site-specific DNA recombinase